MEQGGFNNTVTVTGAHAIQCTIPLPREYDTSQTRPVGEVDASFDSGGPWNGPLAGVGSTDLYVSAWSTAGGCTLKPNNWVTYGYTTPPTAADWAENLNTSTYKRYIKY